MTTEQTRRLFDTAAAAHRATGNRDAAADLEIAREYFTNPDFRAATTEPS